VVEGEKEPDVSAPSAPEAPAAAAAEGAEEATPAEPPRPLPPTPLLLLPLSAAVSRLSSALSPPPVNPSAPKSSLVQPTSILLRTLVTFNEYLEAESYAAVTQHSYRGVGGGAAGYSHGWQDKGSVTGERKALEMVKGEVKGEIRALKGALCFLPYYLVDSRKGETCRLNLFCSSQALCSTDATLPVLRKLLPSPRNPVSPFACPFAACSSPSSVGCRYCCSRLSPSSRRCFPGCSAFSKCSPTVARCRRVRFFVARESTKRKIQPV
jgi:hypothetical protein